MNVCSELRCPFAYKTGCSRFLVSGHCPLNAAEHIRHNQYWLFADDNASVDINDLRMQLESEVINTEFSQRQLWAERTMQDEKPVMAWEA